MFNETEEGVEYVNQARGDWTCLKSPRRVFGNVFLHSSFAGMQKIVNFRIGAKTSMDACPEEPRGNMRPISEYKDRRRSVIISKSISEKALINTPKLLSSSMTLSGYHRWSSRPLFSVHDTLRSKTTPGAMTAPVSHVYLGQELPKFQRNWGQWKVSEDKEIFQRCPKPFVLLCEMHA